MSNAASDIIATTNEFWIPHRIPDLIGETSTLLQLLLTRGNTDADGRPAPQTEGEMIEGGNKVKRTIRFARGGSGQSYSGFDVLNTTPTRTLEHVSYEWRKYAEPIVISFDEELENRSKEAVHDLLQARLDGAMADQMDKIATGIYNSAASRTGLAQEKGLNGLREVCRTNRTWGNIDSTNFTYWDSGHYDTVAYTVAELSNPSDANYIINKIRTLLNQTKRAGMKITHIFTTDAIYDLIEDTIMHDKLHMQTEKMKIKTGSLGYLFIEFRGVQIIADDVYCPAYHMFGLNLDTYATQPIMGIKGRKDAFFKMSNTREPANQLVSVRFLICHLMLYCDQPNLVGMYTDLGQT